MTGEEVPQDVLDAAQRGYSMHGAGLTANIVAAAWPAIEKHIRDRTPTGDLREEINKLIRRWHADRATVCDDGCLCGLRTGDLRERLTEAMRAHYIGDQTTAMGEHLCVCGEWADGTDTDDWDVHLADAVLHVVEDETAALRQRAEETERRLTGLEGALNWQTSCLACARVLDSSYTETVRAEEAERQRDEALAAVQRSREALTRLAFGPVPTSREVLNAWRTSLNQPEETP